MDSSSKHDQTPSKEGHLEGKEEILDKKSLPRRVNKKQVITHRATASCWQ